ncbi:MAG: hypothetical protein GF418_15230, partial [Chitinivibrionales bacterium]|nr:hypothetical protein [Chitinivibrionales bacterium]MBD3396974.1 hypothetical protein [Chitinivibrionales bacterium]
MKAAREILELVAENVGEGVIVMATSGHITALNATAAQCFKRSNRNPRALSVDRMIEEVESGRGWPEIRQDILSGAEYEAMVHFRFSLETEEYCLCRGVRVMDRDGEPASIVLIFRNVSEEHAITTELEQKNLDMARMNSELIRSNAELKRVSELKSSFLSIASHELKTPLTSIKGYSEIIIENMKGKMSASVFRMVDSIARAADRLHRVINNMLDVTRIEQKRLRLNPEELDLAALAHDCIEELSQFSTKRGIRFHCDFAEGIPLFYGDRMRMQQVFTNLLSNALKYSPDKSDVQVRIFAEDDERFHVVVKDAGIGIDKEEQRRIFDPFYEIGHAFRHSTDFAKFMGGGTGLGLSIVKGVVERHGGRIWVNSPGMDEQAFPGSEFHMVLPMRSKIQWDDNETRIISVSALEAEHGMVREEASPPIGTSEKRPKVLIVDDDREAAEICRMVLGSAFD